MTTKEESKERTPNDGLRENLIYGTLLGFVGLSATGLGFAGTLSDTKKSDNQYQHKHQYNIALNAEATRLACRALAIGSVYAICGVSLIVYGIWRATGASNFQEFRAVFANRLPHRPVDPKLKPEMLTWDFLRTHVLTTNRKQFYEDVKETQERRTERAAAREAARKAAVEAAVVAEG